MLGGVHAGALLSPWHTYLATMRLPPPPVLFSAAVSCAHTIQTTATTLLLASAASPKSELLGRVARAGAYTVMGRADVDIGPAAWHAFFLLTLLWCAVLGAALVWVQVSGRSLAR